MNRKLSRFTTKQKLSECEKYQHISNFTNRRVTEALELETILAHNGVDFTDICLPIGEQSDLNSDEHFLPIDIFDDRDFEPFDVETNDCWRQMEAFAILPPNAHWCCVRVINHDPPTNQLDVMEKDSSTLHRVHRLQLYFPFEDPHKFAKRIATAIEARKVAENTIRFRFICKWVYCGERIGPGQALQRSMLNRAGPEVYNIFKTLYEDYHLALDVGKLLDIPYSPITIRQPSMSGWKNGARNILPLHRGPICLSDRLDRVKRRTLLCDRNVFYALRLVNQECEVVRKVPLFVVSTEQPFTLEEFENQNISQTSKTIKYLQNTWVERTTMHLHRWLSRIGEGNFHIAVAKWEIYSMLKIKRLIEQVQYRMQDALKDMLLNATFAYVHFLVNDCPAIFDLCDEYCWDGNLIESPFEPARSPVFYLTLKMNPQAPYYSSDPDTFPAALRTIMDDVLAECHFIHTIEPSLMQSLAFAGNLYLSSLGLLDSVIVKQRNLLLEYYTKALLPLQAYAARYTAYRELFFTNEKEFIEGMKSSDKSSSEIKEDIAFQIRMRENLEHTVPLSIVIGPFWINVQPLREALIRKRFELTFALLTMLTEKLRIKTADVIGCYSAINERMCEKPVSIEQIYDIRAYMESVPELVSKLEDRMRGILYEYEILDSFLHNLPDADFEQKWKALAQPRAVLKQMLSVREFHESEVDRFRKQQFADETSFTASIEDTNAYISKFTTLYDPCKVSEMSVEVRRLWKVLQELIDHGHVMNRRQELFELAPISLNNLYELRHNFSAYRELWTVAADYLKLEETWIGNPLASVDLEAVRRGLQQTHDSLKELLVPFREQPQVLAVVEHFIHLVEAFRPNLDIMELLKCPYLEAIHWSQLAKEIGVKGKLSMDVGYDVFLAHGFRDHPETVRRVVLKAEQQRKEQEERWKEEEQIRQREEQYRQARAERRLKRTEI
uniref:Dynein heavy chain linker domain-containing protein n=1 Tax=Anopheles farauti TaxID=69004 RepID=A0A182QMM9_9DIPT